MTGETRSFDIGLRRTQIRIPFLGWYIGDIETRFWVGKLAESDYFDNNDSNDHNQISGFTFSYSPSFLKGLTLGVTKITLNKWGESFWRYAWPGWYLNTIKANSKSSGEDMKASLVADWVFEKVGFEVYGELGFDDFMADGFKLYEYQRYPFHAVTYTWGLKKSLNIWKSKKSGASCSLSGTIQRPPRTIRCGQEVHIILVHMARLPRAIPTAVSGLEAVTDTAVTASF